MPSILLIEDTERIASFVVRGLQSHGFDVTHASSGEEGLSLMAAVDFDLLILDIGLPGIDGFEVLRRLRGEGRDLPVIVLTARDSVDATVASFEGGADDYISKPFAFDDLLVRVRSRLRKITATSSPQAQELTCGSVTLDLVSRVVSNGVQQHELTSREFTMLEFLMRHQGQVISREQLLSRVWGLGHDPGSNVVDVYVRYLRQKLGNAAIQTVRGAGYRFVG